MTKAAAGPENKMQVDLPMESDARNSILISIIMPVYNGVLALDRAVCSLLGQSFSHWELVAADDGSTDGSRERLQHWSREDARIRVVLSEANRGPGAARNEAIKHSTGETIVYLDCDDEFDPNYLEHVARLRDRADVLIFGYHYLAEGDDLSHARFWNPGPEKHLFFEKNLSTPLGIAHRRDLWDRVAGFDESLWCQEDWEFWKRLARTGAEFLFVPTPSGIYRFRRGSRSMAPRATPAQLATYESCRSAGGSLYGEPAGLVVRRSAPRIIFAAPYSYLDPVDPAAVAARGTLELLAGSGFNCQAFSGAGMPEAEDVDRMLDTMSLPRQARDLTCGAYFARLTFTRMHGVPVTLVQPRLTKTGDPRPEAVACFLAFLARYLDTSRPDVVLTHTAIPEIDPVIQLARRRDIPVVLLMLDAAYGNRLAFSNVDYCVVTSEAARRRYWDDLGLACIKLPSTTDSALAGPAHAEFFRNLRPQPGPPFIPQ